MRNKTKSLSSHTTPIVFVACVIYAVGTTVVVVLMDMVLSLLFDGPDKVMDTVGYAVLYGGAASIVNLIIVLWYTIHADKK